MKRNHCFHLSKLYTYICRHRECTNQYIQILDQTCHLGAYRTVTDGLAIVRRGEIWFLKE